MIIAIIIATAFMLPVMAELPPIDPDKPLYQKNGRKWYKLGARGLKQVSHADPKSFKEKLEEAKAQFKWEQEQADIKNMKQASRWGFLAVSAGLGMLLMGMALSIFLKQYGCQLVGTVMAVLGLPTIGWGLVQMKLANTYHVSTTGGALIVILVVATYAAKEFDIIDWFKERKNKPEVE